MRLLAISGADLESRDHRENTPLMHACREVTDVSIFHSMALDDNVGQGPGVDLKCAPPPFPLESVGGGGWEQVRETNSVKRSFRIRLS